MLKSGKMNVSRQRRTKEAPYPDRQRAGWRGGARGERSRRDMPPSRAVSRSTGYHRPYDILISRQIGVSVGGRSGALGGPRGRQVGAETLGGHTRHGSRARNQSRPRGPPQMDGGRAPPTLMCILPSHGGGGGSSGPSDGPSGPTDGPRPDQGPINAGRRFRAPSFASIDRLPV